MDYPQGTEKVSTCVSIDNDKKLKKHYLETVKRLKKVEQDYLHTSQKYTETNSKWGSLYYEKRRAINRCHSASNLIEWCNKLLEILQKALDKIPTTENSIDHSLQFSMFNGGKTLAQENMMILQQRAQCQVVLTTREELGDSREINNQLDYIQRKMPRNDSRKAVHGLLKEVKEKNKCRDKALSNCKLVCKPTNHGRLRKSVELEIKVLKKLIRELQKDWEEKQHIKQYATSIHKDFRQKLKHLEEKKEHLSGQWDEERKNIIGVIKQDRIGTYPEAIYIMYTKMSNEN